MEDEIKESGILDGIEDDFDYDAGPLPPPLEGEPEFGDPADLYDEDDYAYIPEEGAADVMIVYSEWEAGEVVSGRYEVRKKLSGGETRPAYVVYHRAWRRLLVMKTPSPDMLADVPAVRVLVDSAEAWASLDRHTNVASCYYVQKLRGLPLIFIEYVDGLSLADRLKKGAVADFTEALDLAIQFCGGMSNAHGRGLVHGNIKPGNCFVAEDGTLKITDFGLVRRSGTGGDAGYEETDAVAAAAAAEYKKVAMQCQAPGRAGGSGPAADMYSFGVLLYWMLCGRPPFEPATGEDAAAFHARVSVAAPPAPEKFRPDVPSGLARFILNCLKTSPAERPADFADARNFLVNEYERITGGEYPRPSAESLVSAADSLNDRGVVLYDLGFEDDALETFGEAQRLEGGSVAAVFNRGWMEMERKKTDCLEVRRLVESAMNETGVCANGEALMAELAIKSGDLEEAERRLKASRGARGPRERRGLVLASMGKWREAGRELESSLGRYPGEEQVVALGKCLLEQGAGLGDFPELFGRVSTEYIEEKFEALRLPWIRLERTFTGHGARVKSMAMTAGGIFVVSGGEDSRVRVWDAAGGECLRVFDGLDAECLAVDPGGKFILTGTFRGEVWKHELETKRPGRRLAGHEAWVTCVALGANSRVAVTGSEDRTLRVWNHESGECLHVLRGHEGGVRSAAMSPDGRYIVSGAGDARVIVWESATGLPVQFLERHGAPVWFTTITRDGAFLVSISEDGVLCVWDMETSELIRTHEGLETGAATVSPGGRYLVTGGRDATVGVWDLNENQRLRVLEGHMDYVSCVAVSDRGKFIMSGSHDGTLKKWNISDIERLERVTFTPRFSEPPDLEEATRRRGEFGDRRRRAELLMEAGDPRGALEEIEKAAGVRGNERNPALDGLKKHYAGRFAARALKGAWQLHPLVPGASGVLCAAMTPDGALAAAGTREKTVDIWNVARCELVARFEGHSGFVNHVCLAGGGRVAVSTSVNGELRTWDLASGRMLGGVDFAEKRIEALAAPPAGRPVALVGDREGELALCDPAERKVLGVLRGHEAGVTCAAVFPGGARAVTGSRDRTLRVWDFASGRCEKVLAGHEDFVQCAAVSPDGAFVVSGAGGFSHADTTIRVWDAATGEGVLTLPGHNGWVKSVAFTPDGRFVVSAGFDDRTLRVWDLREARCVAVLESHGDEIQDMALSGNGMYAVSCSWGESFLAWRFDWEYDLDAPLSGD